MNYIETFTLDTDFGFDEKNNLFRVGASKIILSTSNIISCTVGAVLNNPGKNLTHSEYIESIGSIPFVNDIKSFSQVVRTSGKRLVIHYYNKDGAILCYKKFYVATDTTIFDDCSRINRLIPD